MLANNYTIRTANWNADREQLRAVRTAVFVEEQGVPADLEWDEEDQAAYHWLATDDEGIAIGTARMLADGHIGRMAVTKSYRGSGVGAELLQAAIDHAKVLNIYDVYLYAQTHAIGFYERKAFIVNSEEFMDADMPHVSMRRILASRRLLAMHGGNFSIENYSSAAADLIGQVQRKLCILSYRLDHAVFDRRDIVDLISKLARKSRHTEVKLLVVDTEAVINNGHSLVELQRRLSSSISIRKVSGDTSLIRNNLIIADSIGVICQSVADSEKIWGNYNNLPVAQNYSDMFDDLWNRANIDPNLRQLM